MADELGSTSSTATAVADAPASAPVSATPAPAADAGASTAPTETAPAQTAAADESRLEADFWKKFEQKSNEPTGSDAAGDATQPTDDAAAAADPNAAENPAPTEAAPQAPELTPVEKHLLSRFKLSPVETRVYQQLSPDERADFIGNLEQRQATTDNLYAQLQQLRGKNPNGQQQPGDQPTADPAAEALPPELQKFWDDSEKFWGKEGVAPFQQAVMATAQAAIAPLQRQVAAMQQQSVSRLDHELSTGLQAAIDAVPVPEGINKSDPKVRQQIHDAMVADLKGRFDWSKNNFGHSAPRVVASLFQSQINAAQRTATNQQRKQALRSTPDPVTRPAQAAKTVTEEDREQLALDGISKGLAGDALQKYVDSRGFKQ